MMVGWRDLREKCRTCGIRADFSVEYTNDDLPKWYLQDGTRVIGYCLQHVPEEVKLSKASMLAEAQKPF